MLVTVKIAVSVFTPAQAPCTLKAGGVDGVSVGVAVGRREQEPVTLRVTDERNEVRYVTVMVALPAPL